MGSLLFKLQINDAVTVTTITSRTYMLSTGNGPLQRTRGRYVTPPAQEYPPAQGGTPYFAVLTVDIFKFYLLKCISTQ